LVYLGAPIAEVAADLHRSTGLAISTSSATGARQFSGTLSIADVRRDPRTLGPLLGVPVRPVENGWRLGEDK
jgi:transmembrane sensor